MKKLLLFIALLFSTTAYAGPMANVEYIHKVIEQQWGITIPYNPALENPQVAANMKYLLTTVDAANKILNNESKTEYGIGEYATLAAADTVATLDASARLINLTPKFFVTTTADTTEFSFDMSAAGTFQIYWGDGTNSIIVRKNTDNATYHHEYDAPGEYTIGIGSKVTGYYAKNYPNTVYPAISFKDNLNVAGISGGLAALFPTFGTGGVYDGKQPRFNYTFSGCANLSGGIPEDLFTGLSGKSAMNMFEGTFQNCTNLSGQIPEKLFADVTGGADWYLFRNTFKNCVNLSGSIPENLFSVVSGYSGTNAFDSTFSGCSWLTGSIPEGLFKGVTSTGANTFSNTFANCTGLTGIPEKLFGNVKSAPSAGMFSRTFFNCTGLTGSIPGNLFAGIKGAAAGGMFQETFSGCSGLTGPIPAGLFAGIKGQPQNWMYYGTFAGCTGLTGPIPNRLFGDLEGTPAAHMFNTTFSGCSGLTGEIPEDLFAGISGPSAVWMFTRTFNGCSGLTGPSARINGEYLYNIWAGGAGTSDACYHGVTGLSDYANIPSAWR